MGINMKQLTDIQISNAVSFMDNCIKLYGHDFFGEPRKYEFYREQYYRNLMHLNKLVNRKY